MSSQAFFWVNVGLGLILVLIFLIGRKGIVSPSRLNLRRGGKKGLVPKGAQYASAAATQVSPDSTAVDRGAKNLNVLFMYNGHNFDAYEVLGLPAGANLEMVQRSFNQAIARQGSDKDFLEAAFFAIKSQRR